MWDFSIQTDHLIESQRPDWVVVGKINRTCKIVECWIIGGSRIKDKEKRRKGKYQDLGIVIVQWLIIGGGGDEADQ